LTSTTTTKTAEGSGYSREAGIYESHTKLNHFLAEDVTLQYGACLGCAKHWIPSPVQKSIVFLDGSNE
jgi:hypothetical protein